MQTAHFPASTIQFMSTTKNIDFSRLGKQCNYFSKITPFLKTLCAILYFLLYQIRYHWPKKEVNEGSKHGVMLVEKDQYYAKRNSVSYMSDELGLHRVENTSHSDGAVSLHLYSPPFQSCQVLHIVKKILTPWTLR